VNLALRGGMSEVRRTVITWALKSLGAVGTASIVLGAFIACSRDGGPEGGDLESAGGAGELRAETAPKPPKFESIGLRCKLINDRNLDDPTPNRTHSRANLRGTDLGIPVAHGGDLYFFFGDTAGVRAIWPLGPESLPDSVAVASYAAVKDDPNTLCENLRFLGGAPETSLGHAQDPLIERDFAPGWMIPPAGQDIGKYVHNPAGPRGANAFPNMPGDFEVPSGVFSYGGSLYVFYTTVVSPHVVEMKGSYLARWASPSPTGVPVYDILYGIDERFDADGPLRGDFINIAPLVVGEYLYAYGTGEYRKSPVHLARKRLSTLATEGGFERFDAKTRTWRPANDATSEPVVKSPGAGEISVRYFASINRFVMLDQEFNGTQNLIVARFATRPEGPWTDGTPIASLSRPAFTSKYCCINNDCSGQRLMNCDRAGYYGAYMLPDVQKNASGKFTLDFLLSTWDPYNVALMSATFSEAVAVPPHEPHER